MVITKNTTALRSLIHRIKTSGRSVGIVPTMGALHQGHLSLVQAAKKDADFVVVSIFVNPLQFGPKEDYMKYPRPINQDLTLLKKNKVDAVFLPAALKMFPDDFSTFVEETTLAQGLCAGSRPGHFKGVCTVVAKLFNLVQPDFAYFGQKDFQQARIIQKMTQDLDFPITIKIMPIVREKGGLAMSSRNTYLNTSQRKKACILYTALRAGELAIRAGQKDPGKIIALIKKIINTEPCVRIDYLEIRNTQTLVPLRRIDTSALIAVAAYIDKVRLIDNIVLKAG